MEEHTFNFQVNQEALHILCKAVDKYLEVWPGGDPVEQEALHSMQIELKKASFDLQFLN